MSDNDKLEKLLNKVSGVTGYPVEVIKSDWRKRTVVEARHAFCIVAKSTLDVPLKTIGQKVNYRNHATVIWAINNSHIPAIKEIINQVNPNYENNIQNSMDKKRYCQA